MSLFDDPGWAALSDALTKAMEPQHRHEEVLLHPSVARQTRTSLACPDQWQGQFNDGTYFYFRYRGGVAGLGVSKVDVAEAAAQRGEDGWRQIDLDRGLEGMFETHEERQKVFKWLLEMEPGSTIYMTDEAFLRSLDDES